MLIEEGLMQMGSTMNGEVEPYVDPNVHRPGFRHLPMLVDYYATYTPSKVWASIPIDQSDLSAGFRDVSYGEFNNAISYYAHWLAKALVNTEDFETVAYTGPRDIRYPILAMAIAKLQRKLLLPSPTATPAAQAYLVRKLECKTFLYGGGFGDVAHGVAANVEEWKVKALKVPELEACLKEQTVEPVEWRKSWEEARHLPWIVVHTSGSTGLPKPIVHTHQMMTTFEATELMLDASDDSLMKHMDGRRCYSPLATLHMVGMYISLQATITRGAIAVFGPAGDSSPATVLDILRYGNCQAMMSPPLYLDALVADPVGLEKLRGLEFVWFAGASLSRPTAEKLVSYTKIEPWMGTTESGMYFIKPRDDEDWEYYTFREYLGIEFEHADEGLYELVMKRKPELARWQQVFDVFPELDIFRTGDLWQQHPSKPNAWKMIGRADDLIVLSHGKKLNASNIEMELSRCRGVAGLVIGGHGRPRPFVLIEWKDDGLDEEARMGQLWPAIEKANQRCHELVRMQEGLVLFTSPERKLARNAKGSPVRKANEKLYWEEIEQLYSTWRGP